MINNVVVKRPPTGRVLVLEKKKKRERKKEREKERKKEGKREREKEGKKEREKEKERKSCNVEGILYRRWHHILLESPFTSTFDTLIEHAVVALLLRIGCAYWSICALLWFCVLMEDLFSRLVIWEGALDYPEEI